MMNKALMCMLLPPFLAAMVYAHEAPVEQLEQVEGAADLEKVKRAKFRETYVNTSSDFTRYDSVYLGDAHFDYRDVGPARSTRTTMYSSSTNSVFGISEEDRKKFEEIVDEAFTEELSKAKQFRMVDAVDENTIIMRGSVVDIISRVPPEFSGRSEVYLASVGEATLVMEFLDGKTGEVLARISERGKIGRPGSGQIDQFTMRTNSVTVMAEIRRWATGAARRLRSELDSAMGG
jgi:hypothetical protein